MQHRARSSCLVRAAPWRGVQVLTAKDVAHHQAQHSSRDSGHDSIWATARLRHTYCAVAAALQVLKTLLFLRVTALTQGTAVRHDSGNERRAHGSSR